MRGIVTLALVAAATALPHGTAISERDHEKSDWKFTIRQNAPLEPRANRLIPVIVGGTQDTFVPNLIMAAAGDVIQFQFSNGNHTVTQSAQDVGCTPLQATVSTAIHSGHIPFTNGQTTVGTFNLPLLNADPIYLYCATGPHCQNGQVMAINPPNEDALVQYSKISAAAAANIDGTTVSGGTVGQIPLEAASFTPAQEEAAAPPPAAADPAVSSTTTTTTTVAPTSSAAAAA